MSAPTEMEDAVATVSDMADLLRPNAIRAAAALGIADHLARGPRTTAELALATGTRPHLLHLLLRYLVRTGLLSSAGPDTDSYALTPLGSTLRTTDGPALGRFLSAEGLFGRSELGLVGLVGTLRDGRPAYEHAFGRGYWDDVNHDPVFVEAIEHEGSTEVGWEAEIVVEGYPWERACSVLDVGGNNATLLIALLRRYPHLRGGVLDLPNLVSAAGRRLQEAGLADRAHAQVGSFFDPLPAGHDVYLLSGILNDWDDEDSVRILRRAGEAAGDHGRVVVAEVSLESLSSAPGAEAAALLFAATMPAPSRTHDEVVQLAARAGLHPTFEPPPGTVRSLVELSRR